MKTPAIQIKDSDTAQTLLDLLNWVIEREADDFIEQIDTEEADDSLTRSESMELYCWCVNWKNDDPELEPVPVELFKKSNHPFAQAVFLRAIWKTKN